jgi:hypothetical protein
MDFRLFFVSSLALTVACFEDTTSGDGSTSNTTTGGTADGGPSTADDGPSTADDGGITQGDGTGTSGGASETTAVDSSGDGPGSSSDDDGPGTSSGGASSSEGGGSSSEGSSSDDGGTTAACQPITDDASAIGQACGDDGDCPEGYTCQGFSGIVFQQSCQILCAETCECPNGYACTFTVDKSGIPWYQCA